MAMMIHHQDAIIRGAPPMPEHNEYPKHMVHPAFEPATLGTEVKSQSGYSHWVGGTAIRLAPVLVHTEDQEEYYAAKGYLSQGKSDPDAFTRAHAAGTKSMSGYRPQEYPKWAGGVLVNSREEEDEALGARRQQLGLQALVDVAAVAAVASINDAAASTIIKNDAMSPAVIINNDLDRERIAALEASLADIKAMLTLLTGAPTVASAAPAPPSDASSPAMTRGQKGWATRQQRKADEAVAQQSAKRSVGGTRTRRFDASAGADETLGTCPNAGAA